jgi:hypothetical protein
MVDKTVSANYTRTEQPGAEELTTLIELVSRAGGELAAGLVSDDSNKPLIRLRLNVPPTPPVRPSDQGNAIEVAEHMADYEKKVIDYEKLNERHRAEAERRVRQFKEQVAELFARKADFRRSDWWGAIRRADLCLAEDDMAWGQSTNRYLILIGDGQDNVRRKAVKITSGATLILVNGTGSMGSLANLVPIRFENVQSAFEFLRAREESR